MAMTFALLNSLGQVDNLEKVVDQKRTDFNDITENDSSFLKELNGLLESGKLDFDQLDGEQLSSLQESIENLKEVLQERELGQSEEAALLVLLNQLNLLDVKVPESLEGDIQSDSLMALLGSLDQLDIEEVISELNLDSSGNISDMEELLSMEMSELDLENLDNDFMKLLQDFSEEKGIEFKLADLESQEAFAAKLIEIFSGEDGNELLAKIKQEFSAEVRAMEIFAESNSSESSLLDKLQFESERIVFEIKEGNHDLSEMANSKELDLNNILADNSKNLMETENSNLARELTRTSSDSNGEVAKLVSKDLISSDLSEEIKLGSDEKIDNLLKAMLVDSNQVENLTESGQGQLTGQGSFAELLANSYGNSSGAEAMELGNQASFGLDETVMEQMITKVEQFNQTGSNQLEMELEPSWLGKLRLNVSVEQGEVMARFLVDNSFIRHELENNIGLLRNSLVKQGFNIEQITIETRDQQAGWQEGENQNFAEDFQGQDYNQEESGFSFNQEELAFYAENAGELEGVDPDKIDPRMRRWLSMKQYYNSMNLLA